MSCTNALYILSFKFSGLGDNVVGSTCASKPAIQKLHFLFPTHLSLQPDAPNFLVPQNTVWPSWDLNPRIYQVLCKNPGPGA